MRHTGESIDGLRKVNDLIRLFSVIILGMHIYYFCYQYFASIGLAHRISDEIFTKLSRTSLFANIHYTKGLVFFLIIISSVGMGVKKRKKLNLYKDISLFVIGSLLFFFSIVVLNLQMLTPQEACYTYSGILVISYLVVMATSSRIPRHIELPTNDEDSFNDEGESFPQETVYKENDYSINFKLKYWYKKKLRNGFINIVNPFRAILVLGVQGSGKTYSVIEPAIRQMIEKGFTMAVYDFKFPDLTTLTYNTLLKFKHKFKKNIAFYVINFDDVEHSNRCNPLLPEMMDDFSDAVESAKSIMLNLNKSWITKQGDFFVESPVNYLASVIWYLKLFEGGKYCTLPHVIEMVAAPIEDVIPLLASEPELETVISPFYSSLENNTLEQLEGMIDSARIPLTRLASKRVYYIMSGNEFTLDINNPEEPKFVCFGNNDDKRDIYGALLGLYFQRMLRLVNKKGQNPTGVVFDELPTVYVRGIDNLMATGRSNKIATILGFQDIPQLERDYGQKVAEAIFSIVGNIFCGQVVFNTAEKVSRIFGKNRQTRVSVTQNDDTTSYNTSTVMDMMIPASKLVSQSQGDMAGIVSDSIEQRAKFKFFKGKIVHDDEQISKEAKAFKPVPQIRDTSKEEVENKFYQIKIEIKDLIKDELQKVRDMACDD
jgi:hypothetical protein